MNYDGTTRICVLQKLNCDQLIDTVEDHLQYTNDQQLETAHFSQDSTIRDEDGGGGEFRCYQTGVEIKKDMGVSISLSFGLAM